MSEEIDKAIAERDDEWREAFFPNGKDTYCWKHLESPADAYYWLKACDKTNYESIIYFERRANKAKLRRREVESELEEIAVCWDQSKNSGSDPHFPTQVESILLPPSQNTIDGSLNRPPTPDRPHP